MPLRVRALPPSDRLSLRPPQGAVRAPAQAASWLAMRVRQQLRERRRVQARTQAVRLAPLGLDMRLTARWVCFLAMVGVLLGAGAGSASAATKVKRYQART